MRTIKSFFGIFVLAIIVVFGGAVVSAQTLTITPEAAPVTFKETDANGSNVVIPNIEPSAVEVIGNGEYLLVADDKDGKGDKKGKSLKIVETSNGIYKTILKNIQDNDKNPKWEAMAKDGANYYVIGSHNEPDDNEKRANRSRLFRFRLNNEAETNPMNFSIVAFNELDIKDSLKSLGLYDATDAARSKGKIEGLAVRKSGGKTQLIFGLREPFETETVAGKVVGKTQIYAAELPSEAQMSAGTVKLSLVKLFQFDAGSPPNSPEPFKLSSIEYVKSLKGFLLTTSTEQLGTNKFFGNAIWFVSDKTIKKGASSKTVTPQKIYEFEPDKKVEGLSVLKVDSKTKMTLVIVFDNDENLPGMMQRLTLSVSPK